MAAPLDNVDGLRRAQRLVLTNGRTTPNAAVLHPIDAERLQQMKDANNDNLGAGPFSAAQFNRIWGMNLIESEAVPAGTALVGDFRRAVLFDRENTTISVGTANDDFLRNIVRVLGEVRARFAVLRPKAFCAVTLLA